MRGAEPDQLAPISDGGFAAIPDNLAWENSGELAHLLNGYDAALALGDVISPALRHVGGPPDVVLRRVPVAARSSRRNRSEVGRVIEMPVRMPQPRMRIH
jgi:hypothetical protein